jgi:hypothetical protein
MWKMLREWMGKRPVLAASTMTLACLAGTADGIVEDGSPARFLLSAWPTMVGVTICIFCVTMVRRRMGLDARRVLAMLKWTPVVAALGYLSGLWTGYAAGEKTGQELHYIVTDGDWFIGAVMSVFSLWLAMTAAQAAGWAGGAAWPGSKRQK